MMPIMRKAPAASRRIGKQQSLNRILDAAARRLRVPVRGLKIRMSQLGL